MFKPFRKTSPKISKKIRSKKRVAVEWLCGALSFAYFLFYWENNVIDVTRYERFDRRIPQALDGTTVVQISDLHGKRFGRNDSKLMAKVRNEKPDIIAVTGDLIDEREPEPERAKEVISRLAEIAPVFYVTGNH
ncbi:MAG: metallophosphoesterase [Thermoguttaceae bacterium]|nr:metallophosphoesterase [Thermoguttaceae bacterium]